ncbi:MAG TPA: hypothetical protein VF821_31715, partial [Lentzea sp.]
LAPNGLLAVVEVSGMPKFFPDDTPDTHDDRVPHRGADWGPMLEQAGFTVAAKRIVTVHIERSPKVERYAQAVLGSEVLSRDDLALRSDRAVWAAKKS